MHKFASGLLQICFMVGESSIQDLVNNGFDTLVLVDSGTKARVEIEIADLNINELILLGENEDENETII